MQQKIVLRLALLVFMCFFVMFTVSCSDNNRKKIMRLPANSDFVGTWMPSGDPLPIGLSMTMTLEEAVFGSDNSVVFKVSILGTPDSPMTGTFNYNADNSELETIIIINGMTPEGMPEEIPVQLNYQIDFKDWNKFGISNTGETAEYIYERA